MLSTIERSRKLPERSEDGDMGDGRYDIRMVYGRFAAFNLTAQRQFEMRFAGQIHAICTPGSDANSK